MRAFLFPFRLVSQTTCISVLTGQAIHVAYRLLWSYIAPENLPEPETSQPVPKIAHMEQDRGKEDSEGEVSENQFSSLFHPDT